MKNSFGLLLILLLASGIVRAQNQPELLNLPSGLTEISIAEPVFIGTDSTRKKGVIGKNGKWLNGRRFSELLGPVAGTFFGISNLAKMEDNGWNITDLDRCPWITASQSEPSGSHFFVFRMDTCGEILDSFQLSGNEISLEKAGIICRLGFPEAQTYFLPANGKPVLLLKKWMEKKSNLEGIQNKLSLACQFVTDEDSIWSSAFPDAKARLLHSRRPGFLTETDPEFIRKHIPGFTFYYFNPNSTGPVIIYENKIGPRYWTGMKVVDFTYNETALWIRNQNGITCFKANEVSRPHQQIFKAIVNDSEMNPHPVIYSGHSGDYQLESESPLKSGVLPERTNFLFSYPVVGNYNLEEEKNKKPSSPEKSMFWNVMSAFQNDLIENRNLDPDSRMALALERPLLVFEKTGKLFALDPEGHAVALPAVKDTIVFLSRLRFMRSDSENDYFPVWNDLFETTKILKLKLQTSIQAFDRSPELFLVPSQSIPAKFRSSNARSLLYLCDGTLYAENGNRLPIVGKIVSLIGTWNNRLLIRTVHKQKMEIRDAGNKVLYTGVESSISVTEEGSILVTRGDLTFLLIPKNGSLQKGKILKNVTPLIEHYYGEQDRERPKSRNSVVPYKGAYANLVHPLFTTRPEENFFLAGTAEDEEGNVFYQQLRNGLDQIVLLAPLRITFPSGIIRVEGKSGSRTVPIPCMKPIDSIAADGQKRAWMYEDENGFYYRINGKNKRLEIQKVYVSMGGKKVFYQIKSIWFSQAMNGNVTKLDLPPNRDIFFDAISWPSNVIRMMAGPVCVPPGEKSKGIFTLPLVFNPVTGTRIALQPHPSVKFVYRLPDSLCIDRRQKWLVFPEFISTKAGEFLKKNKPVHHAGYDKIVATDEEALSVIASGNPKDQMDLNKLFNGISWLNIHLQADTIEKGVPVMNLPNSLYNKFYIILLRSKTGISVFFANKNETLNVRYEQLYTDQNSDCYAVKRENGLFELFDHVGTLGQFKKIAASCRISERISVILAEKPDGEIVGFYPSDDQQVRFQPPGYLQKIFPHLPSLKACTYSGLLAEEPYLTILPEIYETSFPFGYSTEEGACNDCSILLKSVGITGKLFNPFKIPDIHILNTLQRKILYTGLNTLEIQANGNYVNRSFSFPTGYRCNLQNIGLSQSRKGGYSLFIPMDSLNQGARMNKRWFFEALSGKIFPMEGASSPALLIPEKIASGDYSKINAQDYYLSIGDKPVLLSSISNDISGFSEEGGQLVAIMNPWTGFIDKTGRQKISISCEGGSCSGEVVQFKSGFAALRKDSRILYIDTTGKNPFGLSFACASDFVGNYAIVVDPQPLENMNTKEEEPLDVLEMSVNTHLPDSPPESEKEEDDPATMIQWLHRSGKLIKPDLRKVGRNDVEFNTNSLRHNGEFTLISKGENIIILDTNGACRELKEDYRRYVETMFDQIRNPKLPEISEGLFRVRNSSGTGFCNTEGKLIIPCRFFEASTFSCGISAVIGKGDKYLSRPFYIDRNGMELFTHLTFSEINPFSEGIARATLDNGKSILLDSTGKIIAEDGVPQKIHFKNNMALANLTIKDNVVKRIYEKKGYINRSGVMVIPPKYEQASDFSEGIAVVREKEGGSYFIDQTGNRIPNLPEVSKAGSFSEGLCHIFLPEIQIGFDLNTGTFHPLKPKSDTEGFNWMRANGFSMEQKSPSYSIWKRLIYDLRQETKVLKH
jgi:hypothetical protein